MAPFVDSPVASSKVEIELESGSDINLPRKPPSTKGWSRWTVDVAGGGGGGGGRGGGAGVHLNSDVAVVDEESLLDSILVKNFSGRGFESNNGFL